MNNDKQMNIRLHGELKDITLAVKVLENNFNIVEVSKPYQDRKPSKLSRIYIKAKLNY